MDYKENYTQMKLNYKEYGSGPAIIIMHGFLGMSDNLTLLAKSLADSYRVILPDLPNHGKSPHANTFFISEIAAVIEMNLQKYWNEAQPVIAGHSLGGRVAMFMALSSPKNYKGLISLDMAPKKYPLTHQKILIALEGMKVENINSRGEADKILSREIEEKDMRLFLLKNLKRKGREFSWEMNLSGLKENYEAILSEDFPKSRFSNPALFLKGSNSIYIQEEDREKIKSFFPRAEIEEISDAGHWIHADNTKIVEKKVRNFLSSLDN